MNWNQPICVPCWDARNPGRMAIVVGGGDVGAHETCAWCGQPTGSGIYVRASPASVPFPAADD